MDGRSFRNPIATICASKDCGTHLHPAFAGTSKRSPKTQLETPISMRVSSSGSMTMALWPVAISAQRQPCWRLDPVARGLQRSVGGVAAMDISPRQVVADRPLDILFAGIGPKRMRVSRRLTHSLSFASETPKADGGGVGRLKPPLDSSAALRRAATTSAGRLSNGLLPPSTIREIQINQMANPLGHRVGNATDRKPPKGVPDQHDVGESSLRTHLRCPWRRYRA